MKIYATIAPRETSAKSGDHTIARRIIIYTLEEFEFL